MRYLQYMYISNKDNLQSIYGLVNNYNYLQICIYLDNILLDIHIYSIYLRDVKLRYLPKYLNFFSFYT